MQEITTQNSAYFAKQKKFRNLAMEIQRSLDSKEYIKLDKSFNEFLVQAYRYLLSAKVLDQLKDFTIQPNYECLCRSLAKYAKTTQQMKLLWSTILLKVNGQFDMITTTYVGKVWKELCYDTKYSHICHNEDDIMNNIDKYFKKHSKQLRKRKMNQDFQNNTNYLTPASFEYQQINCTNISNNYYVTPINSPKYSSQIPFNQINSSYIIPVSIPLSPISQSNIILSNDTSYYSESLNSYKFYNITY
ncbi:hypothetical protein PIROE2DRAFT_8851 [Piromyces sp. E2]|nr:hypothetical protein PIROE2DRAFT_8851 [Piromyces sp. E2]|eukprot:OUM64379.1 hypothetical protein PIROE2DRAFT_8851 [Piromyces sp. E2]